MSPTLASISKLPSKSVTTPLVVPFTTTAAPMTPKPVLSTTVPLIFVVCCTTSIASAAATSARATCGDAHNSKEQSPTPAIFE